jgi:hypothetical protein
MIIPYPGEHTKFIQSVDVYGDITLHKSCNTTLQCRGYKKYHNIWVSDTQNARKSSLFIAIISLPVGGFRIHLVFSIR